MEPVISIQSSAVSIFREQLVIDHCSVERLIISVAPEIPDPISRIVTHLFPLLAAIRVLNSLFNPTTS
jgi:hypothetical protein